ncbi:general stress protein [Metabacillus sp. GX 13764]|uniref:general stress protein n=1 Tax=Metabacillus kandeliae TaxID=2900151 RepID=UPI001E2CED78|nr:general stress protein [Metabacillus kandeliae]MCD7034748.1 general stress protein [Metabacillus kandeliae]
MRTFVIENGVQAVEKIKSLEAEGITKDSIYLLAHDPKRSEDLTEGTHTHEVGMSNEGIFNSVANVFRSRGDELRSKMVSLGLSQTEAEQMEEQLDEGKVLLIAQENEI